MSTPPARTDVLITGFGPAGAALALLLDRLGVSAVVVDRATGIFAAPRAIALDDEALRVLQLCGLEEGAFRTVAIPEVRMHSPYVGQFSRATTAGAINGHPRLVTFFQPELEQVLRQRLQDSRNVQVCLGLELVSFTDDGARVFAELRDADGQSQAIEARYLVGADGAGSLVRRLLGLDFEGRSYPEDWLIVDARGLPIPIGHVDFHCDPRRPGPHMPAPGGRQRWEFKLAPGESREAMEQPAVARALLEPWTKGADVEIERVAVYRFHARVARSFGAGRVFLVGDAAHITPPFVGQGLVAGLRDVANLAWKLAWVLAGRARPELLASYDRERRPHARAMVDLARFMGRLVAPGSRLEAMVSHTAMKLLQRVPRLRRLFENLEVKPANRFAEGCFVPPARGSRLRRGGQLPQSLIRASGSDDVVLSDAAIGPGFCLAGFGVDPAAAVPADLLQAWREAGGTVVQIDPRGCPASPSTVARWEDLGGTLVPAAAPMGWAAVVRPDLSVMHDGPAEAAATLLAESMALFATAPGTSICRPPAT